MKKVILTLAACAFTTVAFAQTTTDVKVRDNGTKKVVTKTGKTNVGQALENTADAAGNLVSKGGDAVESGAKKAGRAVTRTAKKTKRSAKKNSLKASRKLKTSTSNMEEKTE